MAIMELLTLIVSVAVLAKSSSLVVDNASRLAKFFGVGQLAIGMLLVAVSTSLPELSVSVVSSAAGEGAIAAGNVFGSNIANILLILGAGAFLFGFRVSRDVLVDVALVLLMTTLISAYIIMHSDIFGNALGTFEGVALLLIAGWYSLSILRKKRVDEGEKAEKVTKQQGFQSFLIFGAGIVVVIISASFVVDSAVKLADMLSLSKSFIGATLIAIGTSLPELSIDLQAIRKKQYSLALGDAIGSNMINLTLVLGVAAAINPIIVRLDVFIAALLFAVVANIVFFYFAVVKKAFGRKEGITMGLIYVLYIVIIFYLQFGNVPALGG